MILIKDFIFCRRVIITLVNITKFILFWYGIFIKHFICLRSLNRWHRMLQFLRKNIYFFMFMSSGWPYKLIYFLIVITRCFEFHTQSASKMLLKYIWTFSIRILNLSAFVKFLNSCSYRTIIWISEISYIYLLWLFINLRWLYCGIFTVISESQVWILIIFKTDILIINFIRNVRNALDREIINCMHFNFWTYIKYNL